MKSTRSALPGILVSYRGRMSADDRALKALTLRRLREFARSLKIDSRHEISVVLCDSATIRRINRRWRQMDKATDVLSFPQQTLASGSSPAPGPLGDIIVSLPYTRRAAREFGISFEEHFSHLLLHGLLHLLGYDHIRKRDARVMESLERKMLDRK